MCEAGKICDGIEENAGEICNLMMKVKGKICVLIDSAYIM